MKSNIVIKIFGLVLLLISSNSWRSTNLTEISEVLKQADFYRGGQVPGVTWGLTVQNIEKGTLKSEIGLLVEAASDDDSQYVLITFLEPRKYIGQKLLVRDNSMWFVRKGLRNPVPISSRQRLTGSAANADVSTANYYKDYSIKNYEEVVFKDAECWLLTLEANNNLVSYPTVKYYITKKENFGIYAQYYGKSGKQIKEAYFKYENKVIYNGKEQPYISGVEIVDNINKEDKTLLNIAPAEFRSFNNSKFQKDRLLD
ncbi:outer membrane lipoprotein-sorting protein [Flavobacteriaceae bacterium M23B6Z8]